MSDETERDEAKSGGADESGERVAATDGDEPQKERVDADGLPLDREPTIDDVRSTEARHGRIAFGCTLAIVLVLVVFWLIRGGVIG